MHDSIFFSVVIPTYNRADLLPKTIESILRQTFKKIEIIIVDDGSTDDTETVIKKLYEGETQLRYFKKINEERGKARNYGLEKALGTYVVFFDSDDLMLPNYLEMLEKGITKHQPNFIAAKYLLVDEKGEKVANGSSNYATRHYDFRDFLEGNFLACHFAVKRSNPLLKLFEEDRAYAILEDWMFLVENLYQDTLVLLDEVGVHMVVHSERSMGDNQIVIERRLKANQKLLSQLNLSTQERKTMTGHSYFFCAIHAFLDNRRKQSIYFLKQSTQKIGLDIRLLILFIKNIIGLSMTLKISRLYRSMIR